MASRLYNAGMTRRRVACRHNNRSIPVTIWYPTRDDETEFRKGIYDFVCASDARPEPGSRGLVVISHGSGGNDFNNHGWAETLARNGYVVAAPRHVGDNRDAMIGNGTRDQLLERPRQLAAAIDSVLADPPAGQEIDTRRIGVMGFSAGAHTGMILLGARPDFRRYRDFSRRNPKSEVIRPLGKGMDSSRPTTADWQRLHDPRIGAAVFFAPFVQLFGGESLARVTVPLRIYIARDESVARNENNAEPLAQALPTPPGIITVPGDHYVFMNPVAPEIAKRFAKYYVDAPDVDRRAIHERIGGELVDFFGEAMPGL